LKFGKGISFLKTQDNTKYCFNDPLPISSKPFGYR